MSASLNHPPTLQMLLDAVDVEVRVYRAGRVPEDQLKDWAARRKYAIAREHYDPSYKRLGAMRSKFTSMLFKPWRSAALFDGKGDARERKTCERLCGCSRQHLRDHIEKQFRPAMTWENHGNGREDWVVDHIKPICLFDWWTDEGLRKAFHWENVQPLWYIEHRAKSAQDRRLAESRRWEDGEYRKRLSTTRTRSLEGTDAEIMAQLARQLGIKEAA